MLRIAALALAAVSIAACTKNSNAPSERGTDLPPGLNGVRTGQGAAESDQILLVQTEAHANRLICGGLSVRFSDRSHESSRSARIADPGLDVDADVVGVVGALEKDVRAGVVHQRGIARAGTEHRQSATNARGHQADEVTRPTGASEMEPGPGRRDVDKASTIEKSSDRARTLARV